MMFAFKFYNEILWFFYMCSLESEKSINHILNWTQLKSNLFYFNFLQKLYEFLSGTNVEDLKVTDQHLDYLRKAREDSSVWMEGLEPVCLKFLKQASPSVVACLLSIL